MSVMYEVLPGKKITGRHRVHFEGAKFPPEEAMGDMDFAVESGVVRRIEEVRKTSEAKTKRSRSKKTESADDDTPAKPGGGVQKKTDDEKSDK